VRWFIFFRHLRFLIIEAFNNRLVRKSIVNALILLLLGIAGLLLAIFIFQTNPEIISILFGNQKISPRFDIESFYRVVLYIIGAFVIGIFYFGLRPLLSESGYENSRGRNRDTEFLSAEIDNLRKDIKSARRRNTKPVTRAFEQTTQQIQEKIESRIVGPVDLSDPDKLFQASRQRLLYDSTRLDKISRRNLYFGIVFSAFALGFLAWPLVAQTLNFPIVGVISIPKDNPTNNEIFRWVAQSYLPRFAVGLLLQFVGFFFLRLYVANESDLKHNRNEITNIETKMMAVQLAENWANAAAKKELLKSLGSTERKFILKKSERMVSSDTITEYNDIKSTIDKLIDKLPRVR